jgi:hypothetical protein
MLLIIITISGTLLCCVPIGSDPCGFEIFLGEEKEEEEEDDKRSGNHDTFNRYKQNVSNRKVAFVEEVFVWRKHM